MGLFVFQALLLLVGLTAAEDFNPQRWHFIDSFGANRLFRSNQLTVNGTFAATQIAHQLNVSSLDSLYIIDLNLQNKLSPTERKAIQIESAYFAASPDRGLFLNWPLVGSLINPSKVPHFLKKEYALHLKQVTLDDVPRKMQLVRTYLETKKSKPVVVIIHCSAGEDRTGELSGAYYLTFQNKTFLEALHTDNTINHEHRDFHCASANALAWQCYHLHYTTMSSLQCAWPHEKYCD